MDHHSHGSSMMLDVFMPHGHCYLWKPGLVWMHFVSDMLIGLAYVGISITLYVLVKKIKIPFSAIVLSFGVFIGACGATHFMEVWTLWYPDYWWSGGVKVITAIASVATGVWLIKLRHPIVTVAEAAKLSEQRRLDLEVLTEGLEQRVHARTAELTASEQRLALAVRARDEFISVASHELKTPLTSLKLHSQLMERSLQEDGSITEPEALRKFVGVSSRQVDKLTRLVEDMLDISRLSTGKLTIEPPMSGKMSHLKS